MRALNPERVFALRIPFERLAAAGTKRLPPPICHPRRAGSTPPTRCSPAASISRAHPELAAALSEAAEPARSRKGGLPAFREQAAAFLDRPRRATTGPRRRVLDAIEFTASTPPARSRARRPTRARRCRPSASPASGRSSSAAKVAVQVGMVDYISPNPGYGFITMLPYQYAGGITYNAFHNAGVRCAAERDAVPAGCLAQGAERARRQEAVSESVDRRARADLARLHAPRFGTHERAAQQIVPAESEVLEAARHLPQPAAVLRRVRRRRRRQRRRSWACSTISLTTAIEHTPITSYVTNKREPFYRWLYGDNIDLGAVGHATLKDVPVCRFVGKKAVEAETTVERAALRAQYAPEPIQFYTIKPVAFDSTPGFELNRELRKVGAGHTLDRGKLLLK